MEVCTVTSHSAYWVISDIRTSNKAMRNLRNITSSDCRVPEPGNYLYRLSLVLPLRITSWYEDTSLKVCVIFCFPHWTPTLINKPPRNHGSKALFCMLRSWFIKFCYIQMKEQWNARSAESFRIMSAGNTNPGAPVWTRTEWKCMEQAHTRVTMWTSCTPYPGMFWTERAGERPSKEAHIFKGALHYYKVRRN